ncbi:MAG: glyoxylate/hydroxypyruvate reductase A [Steroidobacteraceae bacterium]
MSLLIRSPHPVYVDADEWYRAIKAAAPGLEVHVWPDMGDPDAVEVLLGQSAEPETFARLRNLKLLQLFAAGPDTALRDPAIPPTLPMARLVDECFAATMSSYVLAAVLRYHRHLDDYARQQSAREWRVLPTRYAHERTVGIMGLGVLGRDLAVKLRMLGFNVRAWTRTPKELAGIAGFNGPQQFAEFLSASEILVCLLPLTPTTRGILNRDVFTRMPRGSYLINVGRGDHHVVEDIVAALDAGQLAGATLDVHSHDPAPPPAESPLWDHPRVTLTPHIATRASAASAAGYVVANLERVRAGLPPLNLVDRTAGY